MMVSIIIPCYNQGEFLDATINSVVNQEYSNWECVLINDGSNDNTSEIIKKWKLLDTRIKGYHKLNGGLSSARNLGLKKANGKYIQFLDADDILAKNKLKLSIEQLMEEESIDIMITNYLHFEHTLKDTKPAYYNLDPALFNLNDVLFQWDTKFTIPIHCGLFISSLFKGFCFPESLKAKEDWYMWIHLFSKQPKVGFINKSLAYYRIHNKSMTNSNSSKMMDNTILFFDLVKSEISAPNYIKLLKNSNKKFIYKYFDELNKVQELKYSNAYKIGCKIEFILNKIGLKNISQRFIEIYIKK